ncbi:MAG: polysaccharide biosynthesis protein [Desulfurococcaceae archaeon]
MGSGSSVKAVGEALLVAGYGGHAGYAYAVAHELRKAGLTESVILVAENYGYLVEKFKDLGRVHTLVLPRKPGEPLYAGLSRWAKALYHSIKLAVKYPVKVVFASGSNFSIPPSIASKAVRGASIYTLEAIEHFTKPSRSIKVLEGVKARVFLHWEEQLEIFPKGVVVGPVYEPPLYTPCDSGYVLVTTGTLGFKELFNSVEELKLEKVVVQTGDVDPEPYIKRNPSWVAFRYTSDIHKWIAGASVVVAQQGLTASIATLAYGKPTVIAWNPRVVLGAPRLDVKLYAEKIGAFFLEEPRPDQLRKAIEHASKPRREYPSGAAAIAETMLKSLGSINR